MVVRAVRQDGSQQIVVGHPDKIFQARQLLGGIISGPLPSIVGGIPVLGPVLGGGQSPPPPAPAPAPPPAPPPATPVHSPPAPSSTAPPNGGGSHSGGSGGSSSGIGPSSGSGSSSKGSSSGGSSGGSGGTITAGTPQDPSPTAGSGTSTETSQPGSSASTAAAGSILTGNQSNNGSSSSTSSTVSSGGQAAPKNVPLPDTVQSSESPTIPGSPSGISPNDPSPTGGAGDVGNNQGSNALANDKHSLSRGGIAAIVVVVVLVFLFAIVFILRRRSKMRRDERKFKWWFATNRPSQTYGEIIGEEIMPAGTRTARSSFVTTVDHSAHTGYVIPPFPPAMAEVGRGNGARPALIINTHDDSNNSNSLFNFEETRFSIGSASSDHSQYLIVHNRNSATNPDLLGGHTPMSVRPFSPSESFAFPKPPEPAAGSAPGSRPSSSATSAIPSTASLAVTPLPDLPDIPTFPLAVPFIAVSNNTNPPSPANTIIGRTSDPFSDDNPFEDPISSNTTIVYSTASFSEVETVRRPFVPSLPDELSVKPDDTVRVLHSFDDGWALVETVPQDYRGNSEKGLIPIDCLRKPGQNLPAFLASKRVSSYGECIAY